MVSGIFIFDFVRKMMKMMPILPIHSSTFGQMGMSIDIGNSWFPVNFTGPRLYVSTADEFTAEDSTAEFFFLKCRTTAELDKIRTPRRSFSKNTYPTACGP